MSLNDCNFNKYLNFLIMKKTILNLGKALSKTEQKQIFGGIEKCCIPRPSSGLSPNITNVTKPCNPKPECKNSSCAC